MVAGWDHLLPEWFSRLHPRYRTPVGSVIFAAVGTLVFAAVANVGAGNQEAYQFLLNTGLICYGLAYLIMFAIPLLARGEKPSWMVRVSALSGLVMTLLFVVAVDIPDCGGAESGPVYHPHAGRPRRTAVSGRCVLCPGGAYTSSQHRPSSRSVNRPEVVYVMLA